VEVDTNRIVTLALFMAAALLLPAPGGGVAATADGAAGSEAAAPHDLHIVYADFAVEGRLVAGRLRFFKDDLARALGPMVGATVLDLEPGPEADALVMRYLGQHLLVEVGGSALVPELLQSGQDELDREPVWWVIVQFPSHAPLEAFRVRNTLLFEMFGDQRNIMKFVHFPDQRQKTFYFAPGETEQVVRF
jgi:hypothetical protein